MNPHVFLVSAVLSCAMLTSGKSAAADEQPPANVRVVLAGDSTVASGSGWGDAFVKLLVPDVKCINLGRPGRSSKSYRDEGQWRKVLEAKPTWVLIQFGHNDQPGKGAALATDARTTFRENLTRYIAEARQIGVQPVLVTSLTRRNFNAQGKIQPEHLEPMSDSQGKRMPDFLKDYVEAARAVAAEQHVPLIDLNARSVELMNQLGPRVAAAFDAKGKNPSHPDKTHLSEYGATETAKLVAAEIRQNVPELAVLLISPAESAQPITLDGNAGGPRFDGIGVVNGGGATSVLLKDYPAGLAPEQSPLYGTPDPAKTPAPEIASFDREWKFLLGDHPGAESVAYDDSKWRVLDVPHDWSIEDLPPKADAIRVGPFDPGASENGKFTGHTVGGIGWYRKHFTVTDPGRRVAVRFDGVYMNSEIWLNGHLLGEHPHGYTSFEFDLTPNLNPPGQDNVLAVRVRNEGRNSRWYSGSGIYRHVWLATTHPIHVPMWGVFVTTPEVSRDKALVKIATDVRNSDSAAADVLVRARVRDASGKVISNAQAPLRLAVGETKPMEQSLEVRAPRLWSPDVPNLYTADVEVIAAGKLVAAVSTPFGIRKIEMDAGHGFRLNGEPLELRGGCVHHDNGPLGAAAIDRAEERRVELLKANGFNAIRSAHNPPSPAFLDACDRLGMLVIDEVFDQWNVSKENNQQDYHRFFKDWSSRDLAAMVERDRNHPSVIMWSVGNEIPEQFHDAATGMRLRKEVLALDPTRPITQAVSTDWGKVFKNWDKLSDPAFAHLDVAGYNYLPEKYESDHARHPERVILTTESLPKDLLQYWSLVEKHPYVIGDFVWSAMDYLGESGVGHSALSNEKDTWFNPWPWFNAWCGDLDICGFKKPPSFYRDVVWRRSPIEMFVHAPIPPGLTEKLTWWGWPDEAQSWTWPGQEGKPLQVSVYSRCERVRLVLNGRIIGEQPVSEATKLTAKFDVPYAPGELRALGLDRTGKVVAETRLKTTGPVKALKLTVDRTSIRADRNDLAYVTVEVVDANGQRVPNAEIPVHFSVNGAGELAAQGSGAPNEPASFRAPERKTFQGRCLAILRPLGNAGEITLRAGAEGLEPASLTIYSRENP